MTPFIPIAALGAGLYLLFFRKKTPVVQPSRASVAAAAAFSTPSSAPAAPAQQAADAAIVDAAFAEFARAQGARIDADPLLFEQPLPRVPVSAPSLTSADIPFTPSPAAVEQEEEQQEDEGPGILDVANSVFNPFAAGNLFGDD